MVGVRVRVGIRIRSEIYKLHLCDFEIAQHILQIAHIDKSGTASLFHDL